MVNFIYLHYRNPEDDNTNDTPYFQLSGFEEDEWVKMNGKYNDQEYLDKIPDEFLNSIPKYEDFPQKLSLKEVKNVRKYQKNEFVVKNVNCLLDSFYLRTHQNRLPCLLL